MIVRVNPVTNTVHLESEIPEEDEWVKVDRNVLDGMISEINEYRVLRNGLDID